jgi:hypothetical protein
VSGTADPATTVELAGQVATRIGSLDGVVAVALGGSLARGRGDAPVRRRPRPLLRPGAAVLHRGAAAVATELDDDHDPELVGFGDWGPWINGGAWTRIQGTKVDLLYRDLRLVDRVLTDCAEGRTTCAYQPGHPHGFHSHMYAGEVHHNLALHDPDGTLARLRARTSPYPPRLRQTIVRRYAWEAGFANTTAAGAAGRGDLAYVSGCLFRAAAGLVQVLFALNERWLLNEKGAVREADGLALGPPGFAAEVAAVLGGLRPDPATLQGALERMAALTAAVRGCCGDVLGGGQAAR